MLPLVGPLDDISRPAHWAKVLSWATVAGLELGAVGPFGSFRGNIFYRLAYWTVLLWIGTATVWPGVVTTLTLARRRGWPPFFSANVATLAMCMPLAALSAVGCRILWPLHASGMGALEWFGLTATMVMPLTATLLWLALAKRPRTADKQADLPLVAKTDVTAAAGLPNHVAAGALCLQMEDHFVRVHLPGRSHLQGATFGQAMRDVSHRNGLQVHRSWWVSHEAVTGWLQEGRSVSLMLSTGLVVPVARQRVAVVREAGWLDEARRAAPGSSLAAA